MTREDKDLLLQDLSTRLPYGVYLNSPKGDGHLHTINLSMFGYEVSLNIKATSRDTFKLDECKPYLRSMESMSEEEKKEYELLANHCIVTSIGFVHLESQALIDWLNSHHFDYRCLIDKDLAIEAPKGMYNK